MHVHLENVLWIALEEELLHHSYIQDYTTGNQHSDKESLNVTGFWKITHMGVPETMSLTWHC